MTWSVRIVYFLFSEGLAKLVVTLHAIQVTYSQAVKIMRTLKLSLWLLLCNSLVSQITLSDTEDLYIGTFYDVSVSSKGWSSKGVMPAVQMALDHVNKNQSILPGYTLHEDWRDSKVSVQEV